MLRIPLLLLILTILLFGQEKKPDLSKVITIEIRFFKGNSKKLVYKSKRSIDLLYLKDLILKAKNIPKLKCDTTGEILYFSKNGDVFKAYFCTKQTGSKYSTLGVMFTNSSGKIKAYLNYGSGMLIDETFYQLSKDNR